MAVYGTIWPIFVSSLLRFLERLVARSVDVSNKLRLASTRKGARRRQFAVRLLPPPFRSHIPSPPSLSLRPSQIHNRAAGATGPNMDYVATSSLVQAARGEPPRIPHIHVFASGSEDSNSRAPSFIYFFARSRLVNAAMT